MFRVDGKNIIISRGDTGVLVIAAMGYEFNADDLAVFTVAKKSNAGEVLRRTLHPDDMGEIQIAISHDDSKSIPEGSYEWDVRYILGAVLDESGAIIGCREVVTPQMPKEFNVIRTVSKL